MKPHHEVFGKELFDKYFTEDSETVSNALHFASELDATLESEYSVIFEKRNQLFSRIDQGDIETDLQFIPFNSSWKPLYNYSSSSPQQTAALERYLQSVLELTGNSLNRMGINAFNFVNEMNHKLGRASVAYMNCGEDANSAHLESILENISHLHSLLVGNATMQFQNKFYELKYPNEIPPISFRPRGLHCVECHICRNNEPIVASLFDLSLWSHFILPILLQKNILPLLYIPKMVLVEDAKFWNHALEQIEQHFQLPLGTIRVVFLAESFPSVFFVAGMIEAFQGRVLGVNCGRWDYLYSWVQTISHTTQIVLQNCTANCCLPPKPTITTNIDLLKQYQIHVAKTCHAYGIQFIGGMNAQLPSNHPDLQIRNQENQIIVDKTKESKVAERQFYGASRTWIMHVLLLPVAEVLEQTAHATPKDKHIKNLEVKKSSLFDAPKEPKYTLQDFKHDLQVVLIYMMKYLLNKNGAVAIDGLMEDMATSEISCSLNWFYLKHHLLDEQIEQEGGIDQIIDQVSLQAQHLLYNTKDEKEQKLLQWLKRILLKTYSNFQTKPTLEKILYAIASKDDSPAFERLRSSKRFSKSAQIAQLVESLQ